MRTISYTVVRNGHDYVTTAMVPENNSETVHGGAWGLVIAGALLVVTVTFICLLLLA